MLALETLMADLAAERPLFHSEADFQFALAWLIQRQHPEATVRLEYKPVYVARRGYLDLWVREGDQEWAFELKYFTRRLVLPVRGEAYALTNQSAAPIGRYHFLADIERVESVVGNKAGIIGYAIALTNNEQYWKPRAADLTTIDAAFRVHEGSMLRGQLGWGLATGAGTMRGIEQPIRLSGAYRIAWRDYSVVSAGPGGRLRYVAVKVTA